MSTYEDDLRQALTGELAAGAIRELADSGVVFGEISKRFPVNGSKIDWTRVAGAIEQCESDPLLQHDQFVRFFDSVRSSFSLDGPAIYVGDGATSFGLFGSLESFRKVLPAILDIPQHHYFVGPGYSWCLSLTMEGDMAFGRVGPILLQ
ncbi:hypothetical protein ACQR16_31080 [Bradyrhizobium oligotrophicum]|uniref:hypothetical protein n=1 Tax=Bradyrhizobium oligotrophicum TaxID=44255 RepID=UPI003EC12477